MKTMLENLTFITPLQIESNDRLRNCVTVFSYLSRNFPDAKIIVKELDTESKFEKYAFQTIKELTDGAKNITHIFEESNTLFNKSKTINDMVILAETEVVFNYDIDVMMPISSYQTAYNMIMSGEYDIVYPYGAGTYLYNVVNYESHINQFISSGFNLSYLNQFSQRLPSLEGWCQMFNRKKFLENYGLNENFVFVGYEDTEFLHRMQILGLNIGRINQDIYHLDHIRINNSNYGNPNFYGNSMQLFNFIKQLDKSGIIEYYANQSYTKKFILE
jgi:predicted glycosyltransferase involved in capsule biosynthesis